MSFRKACLERGCPLIAAPGHSRCNAHEHQKEATKNEVHRLKRGSTPVADRWYRALVKQGSGVCNLCLYAYIQPVLRVDHIVPIADGGLDEATNLQVACKWCHDIKTREENRQRSRNARNT